MTDPAEPDAPPDAPPDADDPAIIETLLDLRERLDAVVERPLAEHAGEYGHVHATLQSTLASIDEV